MTFSSLQLRKIESDEIPFTQIGIGYGESDQVFFNAPVPDWLPTDEEIAQALEDRRREKARELAAQFSQKVK